MARVSREQSEANRCAIEEASARLFREQGFQAVSVADLMAAAGLTHGGFYGHFASKDELAAIVCAKCFSQSEAHWLRRITRAGSARAALRDIVENYLSAGQRDHAGRSCPLASFAVDVARAPLRKPIRAAFLDGVKQLAAVLATLSPARSEAEARTHALAQLSTMVGALVLARATRGDPLSDQLLLCAQQALLSERSADP